MATWLIWARIGTEGQILLEDAARISAGVSFAEWCEMTPQDRNRQRRRAADILADGVEAGVIVKRGAFWEAEKLPNEKRLPPQKTVV